MKPWPWRATKKSPCAFASIWRPRLHPPSMSCVGSCSTIPDGLRLGCSREVVFSRYSPYPSPATRGKENPRLLVALADPSNLADYGLPSQDRAEARPSIEKALAPSGDLILEFLAPPRHRRRLSERLIDGRLSCPPPSGPRQAEPDRSSASLYLERDDGKTDPVDEDTLSQIFEGARALRLVTLIACHGGTHSSEEPLSGLGPAPGSPRCACRNCHAAGRAVSLRPTPSAATSIATSSAAACVDQAVNESRHQLSLTPHSRDEWSTPILFMRLKDGRLWEPKTFDKRSEATQHAIPEVKWPALLSHLTCIPSAEVVPLLGPGVYQGLLPSPSEIADRWASEYPGFPLDGRIDLPPSHSSWSSRRVADGLGMSCQVCCSQALSKRRRCRNSAAINACGSPSSSVRIAERYFASDPDEPHRILASLQLPLYVTTNVTASWPRPWLRR